MQMARQILCDEGGRILGEEDVPGDAIERGLGDFRQLHPLGQQEDRTFEAAIANPGDQGLGICRIAAFPVPLQHQTAE